MRVLRIIGHVLLIIVLTALTQLGGLVYLLTLVILALFKRKLNNRWIRASTGIALFCTLYSINTFLIIPGIAKNYSRVPLPMFETKNVRPANFYTCLLNRNYVTPELHQIVVKTAQDVNQQFPGSTLNYLDASFPFIKNFPLPPHFSHANGVKLDISFFYKTDDGKATAEVPSWFGYGICEGPRPGEDDRPTECAAQGFWKYSLLEEIVPQDNKGKFQFDDERTRAMVNSFASHQGIGRMFIEPHLKDRLNLTSEKIRFHGCRAVRHDDHLHVQLTN